MKKFGFTLAEVLITIGIIGVVAALTMPTLIANTNSAKFRTQYKKTLAVLSQAGRISQERFDFSYGNTNACNSESDSPFEIFTICGIFNGTLSGHNLKFGLPENYEPDGITSGSDPTGMPESPEVAAHVMLADGSMVVFNKNITGCVLPPGQGLTFMDESEKKQSLPAQCYAYIDVNGPKLPNKEIACTDDVPTSLDVNESCEVVSDYESSADIYPIVIHDWVVEPATNAARSILQKAKKTH